MRPTIVRRFGAVLLVVMTLGGCTSAPMPGTPVTPLHTELPAPATAPYPGIPWTLDGQRVSTSVIALLEGPGHCGYERLTLLTVGWPLGRPARTDRDARQYVRDPGNAHADRTLAAFRPSVRLPDDAVFTGYRYASDELWLSPSTAETDAYLVRGGIVEQWPRARDLFACA